MHTFQAFDRSDIMLLENRHDGLDQNPSPNLACVHISKDLFGKMSGRFDLRDIEARRQTARGHGVEPKSISIH